MSMCRICHQKALDVSSLYDPAGKNYLPAVVYNISGVKILRKQEPDAQICGSCKDAILIAEKIILRCQDSEICDQIDSNSEEETKDIIDPKPKSSYLFCDHCNFKTQIVRKLVAHRKQAHGIEDDRIFPCEMCKERFPQKSALYRHIENDHKILPAEKKFLCIECGSIFISQKYLIEHQLSHGPRRFRCVEPNCKQTFTRAFTLRRHFLTAHQSKSRYHCSDCNEYFKVYDHWQYHNKMVHKNQKRDFAKYKNR